MSKAYPDFDGARLVPSSNHNERRCVHGPDMLILHYTAMQECDAAVRWLCNPESEVSAHYVVHRDGQIDQLVPETRRAWHAGVSAWRLGPTSDDGSPVDLNSRSIGIEICNTGIIDNEDGSVDEPQSYCDVQMKAVMALCQSIIARHNIAPRLVLGHSDIAPERKKDPGEHFPWMLLCENGIGHFVVAEPIVSGVFFQKGDAGAPVEALQNMLALYGYAVPVTGQYCEMTEQVVLAFQRHFRAEKVDGVADVSTIATLHKLLKALPSLD